MQAPKPNREMQWIAGGRFQMGSDAHYPEERPRRAVEIDGFWIDTTPVTNVMFSSFVEETGWLTVAERPADPSVYPNVAAEMLDPASAVFTPTSGPVDLRDPGRWWTYMPGANWRHPTGPGSSLAGLEDHPVVHVAWDDVVAYSAWARMDIPTEAEWEFAAWAGRTGQDFAWGDDLEPGGRHMANLWQGDFPYLNTLDDGWLRTSPVRSYPPNDAGLYDMIGNVWEWTRDWWSTAARPSARTCCSTRNPRGGPKSGSAAPLEKGMPRKVIKGGSHLCAPSYCRRYRPAARHPQPIDTSTSHIGFRCVVREGAGRR